MKNLMLSLIVLTFVVNISIAQNKTFNLNKGDDVFNKISNFETKNNVSFDNATRIRELEINPVFQSKEFIGVDDTILLYLFSNKQYKAYIDKIEVDVNGTLAIRARLIDYNYGYCIISTFDSKSFIKIDVPENNELFLSRYDHQTNKYYLLQIDKSKQKALPGSPSLIPPVDNQPMDNLKKKTQQNSLNIKPYDIGIKNGNPVLHNSDPLKSTKAQDIITLMILYTPSAASWASTYEGSINNTISGIMQYAQTALDNSNIELTVQLVHSEQIDYTELNSNDDLYYLTDPSDGIMDDAHTLRDTYCADVVVLLENIDFTGGLGWVLSQSTGQPDYAFSLTRVQQASWSTTTIHEIGHNMGCGHHKEQNFQEGPGIFTYSAGWRWGSSTEKYCSIMTYNDGSYFDDGIDAAEVTLFSNPSLQDNGYPAGDALDGDNARTIRELKSVIANYRTGCTCTPPSTQASSFTSSAITDNSMTVGWTRGNGTGGVLVVARAGSAVNATPENGTTYTANAAFGSGTQIGNGNYVVYKGTGTSVNVTGLSTATAYHFAIFEYNTTNICFKTPGLTGNATTTGTPVAGCDTLTNILSTDTLTLYGFGSGQWGTWTGHNSYSMTEFAEYYTGLTNPNITGLEVYVGDAYSGGTGGNHKVTFNVYQGGGATPGTVLGSKDIAISLLTPYDINYIEFDNPVTFTG
ncbi:MAG: M12 family metallo-peptidase, partial [Bacteroidales bacterium]